MGGSRTTRSTKARGSSQPPPGSSTTFERYFKPPDMPPGEGDKMAPDAATFNTGTSPPRSPQTSHPEPSPTRSQTSASSESPDGSQQRVSGTPHPCPPAADHAAQAATIPDPRDRDTQCTGAFPRLLRTAQDQGIKRGPALPLSHVHRGGLSGSPSPHQLPGLHELPRAGQRLSQCWASIHLPFSQGTDPSGHPARGRRSERDLSPFICSHGQQ